MSTTDIIKEMPRLTDAQRQRALEIGARIDALQAELQEVLRKPESSSTGINLRARGIGEQHAAELRARLKSFAEDWERPEAAIYDEDPAR